MKRYRDMQVYADAICIAAGMRPTREFNPAAEALADDVKTIDGLASFAGADPQARGGRIAGFVTSSDIPALIEGVARRVASDSTRYSLAHRRIAAPINAPNFKAVSIQRILAGELKLRREGQPTEPVELATAAESVTVDSYSGYFGFSRESMIAAAWDSLIQSTAELISGAIRKERTALVTLLNSNPTLADGTTMFHSDRGNTVSGALTEATLSSAMSALRELPGADGVALQTEAATLCVPATDEVNARKILKQADVPLALFVDSRFTASFVMPDPRVVPVLALLHLNGNGDPSTSVGRLLPNDTWPVKCVHDFAVAAIGDRAVRISE